MVTKQARAGAAFGVADGFSDRENRQVELWGNPGSSGWSLTKQPA